MNVLKSIIQMVCLFFITSSTLIAYDFSSNLFKFQTKLAHKGNAIAQYKLGTMYESGTGVNANMEDALKWYKKSSAQNNKNAIRRITYIEIIQNGFKQKKHAAWLKTLKQDADNRDGEAALLLGFIYRQGIGVKANLLEAKKSLKIAAKASVSGADGALLDVENLIAMNDEKKANKKREQKAKEKAKKELAQQQLKLNKLESERLEIKRLELENREIKKYIATEKQGRKEKLKNLSEVISNNKKNELVVKVPVISKTPEFINKTKGDEIRRPTQANKVQENAGNTSVVPWYERFKQQVNNQD